MLFENQAQTRRERYYLESLITLDKPFHLLSYLSEGKCHPKHNDTVAHVRKELYVVALLKYTIRGINTFLLEFQ